MEFGNGTKSKDTGIQPANLRISRCTAIYNLKL